MLNDSVVHDVIGCCVQNNHVQYKIIFEHYMGRNPWEHESIVWTITDTVLLSKVSWLDSLAGLQAKSIQCEANACYDTDKLFLQSNCNSASNRTTGNHWDGTFKRCGYVMQIAEYLFCHCTIDNGESLYLVGWGEWRKKDPSWVFHEELIRQIKGEYIYLLMDFDNDVVRFMSWTSEKLLRMCVLFSSCHTHVLLLSP